eukprot:scaffold21761_cov31-Tisochrysis_lutea.AAC.2
MASSPGSTRSAMSRSVTSWNASTRVHSMAPGSPKRIASRSSATGLWATMASHTSFPWPLRASASSSHLAASSARIESPQTS